MSDLDRQELKRTIERLVQEKVRQLTTSALTRPALNEIASGDVTVHGGGGIVVNDGGSVTVQGGGGIDVRDGGSVAVDGGGGVDVGNGGSVTVTDGTIDVIDGDGQPAVQLRRDADGNPIVQVGRDAESRIIIRRAADRREVVFLDVDGNPAITIIAPETGDPYLQVGRDDESRVRLKRTADTRELLFLPDGAATDGARILSGTYSGWPYDVLMLGVKQNLPNGYVRQAQLGVSPQGVRAAMFDVGTALGSDWGQGVSVVPVGSQGSGKIDVRATGPDSQVVLASSNGVNLEEVGTPAAGLTNVLYASGGALYWRGGSGTVTKIANA